MKKYAFILKILIVITSLGGVIFSCVSAVADGYSHWGRRLLYFTAQSNIWIGLTALALVLLSFSRSEKAERLRKRAYFLRYLFTVSITVTGLVFCFLLAPFAEESYHVWSPQSLLTHVFTPLFAIADFFLDKTPFPLGKKHLLSAVLPPLFYFAFASVLELFGVDFGRGEAYPYFFLNFRSPVGLFGFSKTPPFVLGSFYWILLLLLLIVSLGALYLRLTPKPRKK